MNQIINIGVDTIEIDRVVRSCRRQYFLDHIFSEKEPGRYRETHSHCQ